MGPRMILEIGEFEKLPDILKKRGYVVSGPTVQNGAVVYDEITSVADLPIGFIDEQSGGKYRLTKTEKPTYFAYVVGPQSCKQFLFPPTSKLFEITSDGRGFKIKAGDNTTPKQAVIGVRACELHAIAIQDKVFLEGPYQEPNYRKRRENLFIVAANCTRAGGTCFCASMGTGPKVSAGFDLCLTELMENGRHYFVVESGSDRGSEILAELSLNQAGEAEIAAAENAVQNAAQNMGRVLDTNGLKELLDRNFDHSRWSEVAKRCLSCGNCTLVCPTCFCSNIYDSTALDGSAASRLRQWDSCFTLDHSYIFGGSIRVSALARYRQWLTHKLANWQSQFGVSGCVGCGRCITWCPVGIDLTEEAAAIRTHEGKK